MAATNTARQLVCFVKTGFTSTFTTAGIDGLATVGTETVS